MGTVQRDRDTGARDLVWGGWPASSFWVIGLFVGVTLLLSGFARIMLALALRGGQLHHPMTA